MLHFKTTMRFLAIAYSVVTVTLVQGACTLNRQGLIGRDSGSAVIAAFTYDLTVKSGTSNTTIVNTIVPAIERAIARKSAPLVIADCAPTGRDTSSFADIVGMDIKPKDFITRAACATKQRNCFTIRSAATIYVESTSVNVATTYQNAVRRLVANKATFVRNAPVNAAIVDMANFQIVKIPTNTTDVASTESGNFATRLMKDDPALFYGVIVGAFAVVIALVVIGFWCANKRRRRYD
jgi:hypothetical protein